MKRNNSYEVWSIASRNFSFDTIILSIYLLLKQKKCCYLHVLYSRLQRNNINQYWIPSTTKISPDLGCYIQNKLGQLLTKEKCTTGDRSRLLFAYLCVSKVIRATKVCALQVNCFLVMVITSHLCKETLTETHGQSGEQVMFSNDDKNT